MNILFFLVSFIASVAGAICGIGGGVIIKPILDMTGLANVATISFLSGCTVLVMCCYNVTKGVLARENQANMKQTTFLAVGAVLGGVSGKQIFTYVKGLSEHPDSIGALQAGCLAVITIGALLYTILQKKIKTYQVRSRLVCVITGIVLGILSSFLGIGGGPINLVVLYYFFSMDIKQAAQNSLYIIFFSQVASLLITIITGTLPEFTIFQLVFMLAGGFLGGIVGREMNKKMRVASVEKLFQILMVFIILINVYNIYKYS